MSRPDCTDDDPDLEALIEGVKFVRKIAHCAGLKNEDHPGASCQSDAEVKAWIKREAWGHHACGTCRMGRAGDPSAVLDSQFRVLDQPDENGRRKPVAGLRVVDASIFWRIPGYFIVTDIYMASEKAADTIQAAWRQ